MIRLRILQLNNAQPHTHQTGHVLNMPQPPPNYSDAMSNKFGAPNPNYNKY